MFLTYLSLFFFSTNSMKFALAWDYGMCIGACLEQYAEMPLSRLQNA
jgi:hypothetical protein